MIGDEAVRFCGLCKKNVYQISYMTNDQVEELLAEVSEKKCGRFYQRKDGTLLTADCSVGLKRKRRKRAVVGMGAGILSVIGVPISSIGGAPASKDQAPHSMPIATPPDHGVIMGEVEYVSEEYEEPVAAPVEERQM